jgi:hypothetical protein
MRRRNIQKILLLIVIFMLVFGANQPTKVRAQDHRSITITGAQLAHVLVKSGFTSPLSADPIQLILVNVADEQFTISIYVRRTVPHNLDFIWIKPSLDAGKITCTISKIVANDRIWTQRELTQPNPYFSNLNADTYCNMLLSPFIVGFGPGAVLKSLTLKHDMVFLELGGTLAPEAPIPAFVAECRVSSFSMRTNLRSGPGLEYPVLMVFDAWYYDKFHYHQPLVLDWQGDWLKIDNNGTVGWVWKHYAGGTRECVTSIYNRHDVWEVSDHP